MFGMVSPLLPILSPIVTSAGFFASRRITARPDSLLLGVPTDTEHGGISNA